MFCKWDVTCKKRFTCKNFKRISSSSAGDTSHQYGSQYDRAWYLISWHLPLTHFVGKSIHAHGKKESGRGRIKRWEKHFIICQDTRTGASLLFHHYFKENGKILSSAVGLVVLHPHLPPLYYSSLSRAMRWPPPAHADLCSDAAWRMRCVTAEHSKLTGSHRSRSGPWPFITSIL